MAISVVCGVVCHLVRGVGQVRVVREHRGLWPPRADQLHSELLVCRDIFGKLSERAGIYLLTVYCDRAKDDQCGLNGNDCRPFSSAGFAFRCPANCKSLIVLDERTVGNQTFNYQPFVVGGQEPGSSEPGIYRADSYLCQAAIHAGVVSDVTGGCGVVALRGAAPSFPSVTRNGLTSIAFPSTFPKSFSFVQFSSQVSCPKDPRWPLLAVTVTAIVLVSLFTTSPAVFYFSTFGILISHVGVVSDPPNLKTLPDLFSVFFSRLVPAAFVAYVLYLYAGRPLLQRVSAPSYQLSKTILYLTPAFIGALNNYTFATWIPIQRLTPHDLENEPGAKAALAIIIIILVVIVLSQAWYIRQAGLLVRYLKLYLTIGVILLILLPIPVLRLRIHHYILAMILMPGTSIPIRPSLIYQGLLLGLFINGVARWGFASLVETPEQLGEDPTTPGGWWGASYPNITNSSVTVRLDLDDRYRGNGNITFNLWEPERMEELGVDGISVLVNDVERWRGYLDEDRGETFIWRRKGRRGLGLTNHSIEAMEAMESIIEDGESDSDDGKDQPQDLFFRFAFLRGSTAGHYGPAGVWLRDGRWIPPKEEGSDEHDNEVMTGNLEIG